MSINLPDDQKLEDIMKKIKMIIVSLTIALFIPAASFALIEAGLYGGYSGSGDTDMSGYHYGAIGHFTWSLPLLATFGVGGYYQQGSLSDSTNDIKRKTAGLDVFGRVDLPFLPLKPYGRMSTSAWDRVSGDISGDTRYFKDYSMGGGLAWFMPLPIVSLQLYTEYLYTIYNFHEGERESCHTVNLGVKAGI